MSFEFGTTIREIDDVVWEKASGKKTSVHKSSPTYFIDRPHDSLVIMAKATLKGNYLWVNEIEIFVGISCEVLLGIKVSHLHYCPCEDVCGSMAQWLKCVTRSLEPLHNPCFVARFLMNDSIQHATCRCNFEGGSLAMSNEFKYLIGYKFEL